MTSVLNVDEIAAKDGTSPVALTKQQAAKVYFKYTQSTPAVNDSFNVSSITDNSTGSLTPNYTNSFDSSDYGVSQSSQATLKYHGSYATGSIIFRTRNYSNSDVDEISGGAMFGDLA